MEQYPVLYGQKGITLEDALKELGVASSGEFVTDAELSNALAAYLPRSESVFASDKRAYSLSGEADINDSLKFYFKTTTGSPTALLFIKGERFPLRYYLELGQHAHSFTGTAHGHGSQQYAKNDHGHSIGVQDTNHNHNYSGTTSTQPTHAHGGVTTGGATTGISGQHEHTYSGTTQGVNSSHSHALGSSNSNGAIAEATATGTIGNTGVNAGTISATQKTYGDTLKIYVDGTDITSSFINEVGWAKIGDGTSTHAFHTTGSGEVDIAAFVDLNAGLHYIEIKEETAAKGCRVLVHLDVSG